MLQIVKKALKNDQVSTSGKDVIVKSKMRQGAYDELVKYLIKNKIKYSVAFKKSKSSSMNVINIDGEKGDIVFKPILQKGAGGLKFEKELEIDLNNYFNGADRNSLKHGDVIKELETVLKFSQKEAKDFKVIPEGSKNQKRALTFSNNSISISNTTGQTLTDLTVKYKGNTYYLSLKMSASYYTLSASIFQYFLNTHTQVDINEFFGFNGQKMGGFGKEYACMTKKPAYEKVKTNLESVLAQAYGTKVIIVHKKVQNDVLVTNVKNTPSVNISNLTDDSYVYPEAGIRKYANIKTYAIINNHKYKVDFQFRGTTATDTGPRYLRILMERL
jgi:hypothetical protein